MWGGNGVMGVGRRKWGWGTGMGIRNGVGMENRDNRG